MLSARKLSRSFFSRNHFHLSSLHHPFCFIKGSRVFSTMNSSTHEIIEEGKARVAYENDGEVFYNPVQIFNRDLSVACIRVFGEKYGQEKKNGAKSAQTSNYEGLRIMEALSASGLRSIRYALEIENVQNIIANDVSESAVESIRNNLKLNNLSEEKVTPSRNDASLAMLKHKVDGKLFQVVDLDPYGAPVQFLDSALQVVEEGGLLCVTCTDMAVLCGVHGEACFAKYGSMPLKTKYCHESGLRIVLSCIQNHAGRHKKYIVPMLSLSIDFYCRVFVRVYTSPSQVKNNCTKLSYAYACTGCESFHLQPLATCTQKNSSKSYQPSKGPSVPASCPDCGGSFRMG
eukprot:Sdes_comp16509_c0_seq1m5825